MKRLLGAAMVAMLCVSLAGCATLGEDWNTVTTFVQQKILNPFNDNTVAALGVTLGTSKSATLIYGALPLCPDDQPPTLGETDPATGQFCHDAVVLSDIYGYQVKATSTYTDVANYQKAHPQGSVLVAGTLHDKFTAAQSALSFVTDLINQYVSH